MLDVLLDVIAPVLCAAVVGGAVCRRLGIAASTVSPMAFFLLSPALVYSSMSTIELGGSETARVVAVAIGTSVVTCVAGLAVSSALRLDSPTRSAVALTSGMGNGGNLGLPVATLAFGTAGLEVAIIAFVCSAFVVNSLGVLIASRAVEAVHGIGGSLIRVPALWAAVAGFAVNATGLELPAVVAESTRTLGAAAVPMMLIVLGLQLSLERSSDGLAEAGLSMVLRLLAGPAVAWGLASALGLDGVTRNTLIVLGGMPSAVYTTILATQFGARPALVTRTVMLSTLASVVTLTVLIAQYR